MDRKMPGQGPPIAPDDMERPPGRGDDAPVPQPPDQPRSPPPGEPSRNPAKHAQAEEGR